jgi:hypothetical protein
MGRVDLARVNVGLRVSNPSRKRLESCSPPCVPAICTKDVGTIEPLFPVAVFGSAAYLTTSVSVCEAEAPDAVAVKVKL